MYATIINGSVAALTEDMPLSGAMYMETFDWDVQPGWVLAGGTLVPPPAAPEPDPRAAILEELANLDVFVPRSVEEMYAAASVKGLAEINVARIARKEELRAQLATLEG